VDPGPDFDSFVLARSAALLRSARLLTGDWALAQDLVQTALVKVWPRWDRVVRNGDPDMYVRRVMVTTYATWWRRRWRSEVPHGVVPDHAQVGDETDLVDRRAVVAAALAGLSRGQRAVIVLRHFDDLTEAQTAAVLGCSVGTVKSQHARAVTKLRRSPQLCALVDAWSLEVSN
jgi:RNA polymerase sigma-70 factor (sigma-E family)